MAERGSVGVVGFIGFKLILIVEDEASWEAFGLGRWGWPGGRRGRMGCSALAIPRVSGGDGRTYNSACWVSSRI